MIYCFDLDGTLIKNDMSVTSFWSCLKKNPLLIFKCLFWYIKGKRSLLKLELSKRYKFDPKTLNYNQELLTWINELKKDANNSFYLVSGSTQSIVDIISNNLGCFDKAFGSSESVNLIGENKLAFIKNTFGNTEDICYVGNSNADLKVWKGVRLSAVVSNNEKFINKVKSITTVVKIFKNSFE